MHSEDVTIKWARTKQGFFFLKFFDVAEVVIIWFEMVCCHVSKTLPTIQLWNGPSRGYST